MGKPIICLVDLLDAMLQRSLSTSSGALAIQEGNNVLYMTYVNILKYKRCLADFIFFY